MKIKYLGTAAYEGVPALFCNCRVCAQSKRAGGRNLRSRSQALINDEILMDFNADTVWHYQRYGFDWNKIKACLITHSHCDHLYPDDVEMASPRYTHDHAPIRFYSGKAGCDMLRAFTDKTEGGADVTFVEAGKRIAVAGGKYTVLALEANHNKGTSPVFYSLASGGKRLLYAHDTGYFPEASWRGISGEGRYDLVSLDCTGCLGLGGDWVDGHMSINTDLKIADRMREEGLADSKTIFVLNHFSHNGGQTYDEMLDAAGKKGFIVAYDGLEIEF